MNFTIRVVKLNEAEITLCRGTQGNIKAAPLFQKPFVCANLSNEEAPFINTPLQKVTEFVQRLQQSFQLYTCPNVLTKFTAT